MARDRNDETLVERADPLIGAVLDRRYRIDERLAAGGFGAIYRAEHVGTKRQVALKVLLPSLTHDPGVVARFRREGATLTALRSPNTITAYELGEAPDGTLYIVMELLRGVSLFERYRSGGRMPWRTAARIGRDVCRSLEEAHGLGIIHRDLKPTNIHLEPGPGGVEVVKVLDFGIAKILQSSDFDSTDLTSAGQMIGTLDYMSPEQMVGSGISGQTDQYTLGIVMYEMVAGKRPFADADSAVAVLAQMLKTNPPPLIQRAPVPPAFNAIVMRCLEREFKDRYPDVRALGAALEVLLGDVEAEVSEVTRAVSTEQARAMSAGADALHTVPFEREDADPHDVATVLATGDLMNEAAMTPEVSDEEDHTVIGSARGRNQAQRAGTASEVLRAAPMMAGAPAATTQSTTPFLKTFSAPVKSAAASPGEVAPARGAPQAFAGPPAAAAAPAGDPAIGHGAPPPFGAPSGFADVPPRGGASMAYGAPPPFGAPSGFHNVPPDAYGAPPSFGGAPPGYDPSSSFGGQPGFAQGAPPYPQPPPTPFSTMPQAHYGAPPPPYGQPMAPYGQFPPTGVRPYDMAASAAREAAIRRIVWIVVLAAGTIVGIALATQL